MMIKAEEMKIGQVVRFQYGDYDNWVSGKIQEVEQGTREICAKLLLNGAIRNIYFSPKEDVEVSAHE